MNITDIQTPFYLMEEEALRRNLSIIQRVKEEAGVEIIMAFKAFAVWKSFPIIREYIPYSTASSIHEAQLAFEEMGSKAHTYTPAYTDQNIDTFMRYSSHLTFNSLNQYNRFTSRIENYPEKISCGLRINPEYSPVETLLYNPCAPGSRFGILSKQLGHSLPKGIEGFHCHTLCESNSFELEKTLSEVERLFGRFLPHIKWLNMGGGHLMTRHGYNIPHLIGVLKAFKAKHPHIELILEPGSAFTWQTGTLQTSVVDVVENKGIRTAIIDASFTCHMPDCLEMPYQPTIKEALSESKDGCFTYRIGGNSCLSGDFMGDWHFDHELEIGERITFLDMIHYTIVKTNTFNGVSHPSIAMLHVDGEVEMYRQFEYIDYKNRMS